MTAFSSLRSAPALLFLVALLTACGGGDPVEPAAGSADAAAESEMPAEEPPAAAESAMPTEDPAAAAESAAVATSGSTAESGPTAEPERAAEPEVAAESAPVEETTTTAEAVEMRAPSAARLPGTMLFNDDLPAAGHPGGSAVPLEARAEDVSNPRTIIGNGSPAGCTSAAFVRAVARGGVITFNCGPAPVTIVLARTAKIVNDAAKKTVIDGGGKVTLSGGGERRIIYMNTCDEAQVWTTSHCQDQDHPRLTLQNLTFVDGAAHGTGPAETYGGGAVFARGGRLKIVNSRFFRNRCDPNGPDVGGAAVRALDQYRDLPLYVVNSTFGGRSDLGNVCSNGGALSSIGVSFHVYNSLFTHNRAIGAGANPARPGTPGGGSGGAIYNDGNTFQLRVSGSRIVQNRAREGGGAIFFVSNDLTGTLHITRSQLRLNPNAGFWTRPYYGIFYLGNGLPQISGSTLLP